MKGIPENRGTNMSRACLRPISGLEVIERCLNRVHREDFVFGNLSEKASEDLSAIAVTTVGFLSQDAESNAI